MTPLGCSGGSQLTRTESLEYASAFIFSGAEGTKIKYKFLMKLAYL